MFTSDQSKEPEEKQEKFCEIYFILSFLGLCEIMFFLHLELRDVIKKMTHFKLLANIDIFVKKISATICKLN